MDWAERLDKQIRDYLPDVSVLKEEPMAKHTSFRVGGPAKRMAFPEKSEQLVLLLSMARECGARPLIIGNGTNLLAPDGGLDRLVIGTDRLCRLEMGEEPDSIVAGCGVPLARLADFACRQGLAGLEFAHGIPGTVGGGVCMNAGAYGGELKQVAAGVSALFPEEGVRFLSGEELAFGYRRSFLTEHPEAAALHAVFRLTPGSPGEILTLHERYPQPAAGMAQRGQHLQAPGGVFRRDPHRPVRFKRPDGGRGPGIGKARGLHHQPGRGLLC